MLMKPNYVNPYEAYALSHVKTKPNLISRIVMRVEAYLEYRRQRQALLSLDDRLLKDIGLSRAEAIRISEQPFHDFHGTNSK